MMLALLVFALLLCMGACFALGYEYHKAEPEPESFVSLAERLAKQQEGA